MRAMVRLNGNQRTGVNLLVRTTHLYQPRDARGEDGLRHLTAPPPGYESGAWVRHVEIQVDARDPRGRGQRCLSPVGGPRERRGNTIPYTVTGIERLRAAGRTDGHNRVLGTEESTETMAFKADLLSGTRHGELVPMLATATASDYTLSEQTWTEQDLAMQDAIEQAARRDPTGVRAQAPGRQLRTQPETQPEPRFGPGSEVQLGARLEEPAALGQLIYPHTASQLFQHDVHDVRQHAGRPSEARQQAAPEQAERDQGARDEEWISF